MDYLERTDGGRHFVGSDVNIFRAIAIASALRFYSKTGMRVNRAYTPKAMIAAASQMCGRTFKARDYIGAAEALEALADAAKEAPRVDQVQS